MQSLAEYLVALRSNDSELAESAALALPTYGEAGLSALRPLLEDSNSNTRWWAVRSLAGFAAPAAGELLTAALDDADVSVQHCAALALCQHKQPAAVPALVEKLHMPDRLLARLAGNALVAQAAAAVEPLIAAVQDEHSPHFGRVEAARALAQIGDTRAVPALFALLDSESSLLEHWAAEGLQKMGIGMAFFKP